MTVLQLTGGKELRISMSYEEIRDLLERAIADGKLLELARPDGTVVLVNPNNVDVVQNGTGEEPGEAVAGPAREHELDEKTPA